MGDWSSSSVERTFGFGSFRLLPAQQILLEGDTQVRLGGRALEILTVLVERAGELVSKGELIARAWPKVVVEENNLKVHIAAVRRALGDGQNGHRYVCTVPGRGYRFVAPVECSEHRASSWPEPLPVRRPHNLPLSSTRVIGRADTVDLLLRQLGQRRFVTVVGAGGIGKTTVALAVAGGGIDTYADGVWLVELAPLLDERFVPSALASAIGLTLQSKDAVGALIAYLRDRQMLILLDSCEHVIEAAASFAEKIIRAAPQVHILATSREPLRANGEFVHRLASLNSPPVATRLTAEAALRFPAVQLFVERARERLDGFELTDGGAPLVAEICRKLEGVALAIELAATRIDAFGLREISELLSDRFRLLGHGRRNALQRHRSLSAALDWSYEFLPEDERVTLRRLSVFSGFFTLESASALARDASVVTPDVVDGVANLVAKSLISADVDGSIVQYRLLDTTRAYAQQKLAQCGEFDSSTRRHAAHFRDLFERAAIEWEARPTTEWLAHYSRKIDDVRSALSWAFSPSGDIAIGVSLTIAAIPLWMHLSLLDECRFCVERALNVDESAPQPSERDEMKLYAALGAALLYARGPLEETNVVWTKALQLAEQVEDSEYQLRVLWGLGVYRGYIGDARAGLALAERFRAIATEKGDRAAQISVDRQTATALHYLGDQAAARFHLERMLGQYVAPVNRSHIARFQLDQRAAALGTLSNVLWLQGFPDQAVRAAQSALEDAKATDHALSLCNALVHASCPISLYVGDLTAAERALAMLHDQVTRHPMTVWNALYFCLRGMLLVKRGDASGLPLLRGALDELRDVGFRLRYSGYLGALAYGLGLAGHTTAAHVAIEEAFEWSARKEECWCMAELLRIKGELSRLEGAATDLLAAEEHYERAFNLAQHEQTLSWQLRAATSLAQHWHGQGRTEKANEVLSSVYDRFNEGFETNDLATAHALLEKFRTILT